MPQDSQLPRGAVSRSVSGIIQRITQGARHIVTGGKAEPASPAPPMPMSSVDPAAWMGPQLPLQPQAPADVKGRAFDYPVGYNISYQPRSYEPIGFRELRLVADNCDLLRLAIETRKDQIEALPWTIKPREGVKGNFDKKIGTITDFLQTPDRRHDWAGWLRALVEDHLVIDAATIYRRRKRSGALYSLDLMDGSTILPLITDDGRYPLPPDPAYQQIDKGVPAAEFDADELLYLPRNVRTNRLYGYPPVQQVIVTVSIAMARATHQLAYYTDGSLPDALIGTPANWTPDQIVAFQRDWDDLFSGNLRERRHGKFVPSEFKYQEIKQSPLKDVYDEWLARVICYAFSLSPEPFVQHVNRATAESAHDRALEEGLAPIQHWIKRWMDRIIREDFDSPELEFSFSEDTEQDPKTAADINVDYVKAGILSVDEARLRAGEDPLGGAYAFPMLATATGYVAPVDPEEQQARADAAQQAAIVPKAQGETNVQDNKGVASSKGDAQAAQGGNREVRSKQTSDEAVAGSKATSATRSSQGRNNEKLAHHHGESAYTRLRKAAASTPIPFDRPVTEHATAELKRSLAKALNDAGKDAAKQVRAKLGKLAKDDDDDRRKAEHTADDIDLTALDILTDVVPAQLETVSADSGSLALAQVGVGDRGDLVNQVNERAVEYARDRAAEMVGKRWANGELVDNPNAEWRIDEATRNELQSIISQGLEENIGTEAIADLIERAAAFSEDRAELIAHTEVRAANSQGTLEGYKAARDLGIKIKKVWLPDDDPCPDCQANADMGPIDLSDDFVSGDDAPPAHPHCRCSLTNEIEDE